MIASPANSSQIVMSSGRTSKSANKTGVAEEPNSSQIVMSSRKYRGIKYRPFVFTEQGIAMLSSVLRSPRAVQVNIEIMRAFVKIRQWVVSNADLSRRLVALEKKYDYRFKVVFDALRETTNPIKSPKREIGFHAVQPKPQRKTKALSQNSIP